MPLYGSFSGNPKTEWVVDASGDDRDMVLLEDFSYTDPKGRVWPAPKGSRINGASIPQALWSTVGSPYTDDYRRASVVHDVACESLGIDRKDADVMFYYACLAGGCGRRQAQVLYAGVRIGAWAQASFSDEVLSKGRVLFGARLDEFGARLDEFGVRPEQPAAEDVFLQSKLSDVAGEMSLLPVDASIGQLDEILARHLKM